ncbi:penicillin acylase family protein [Pseudoalteromonas sp. JBTF-M23]|uniref:Penicillin acylase family protein n=1 Tax=Pseudoalteromonas caenipelagi TaxID=2726988 RepID=A0A849VKP8_9GAMM|nr:penicillin acylase family protein [Pseudoalteromonas caenipelagi]NOU53003.1 penicillin acylase family protein [Pseudoalteromonas caenipelagi]
MLKLLKWLLVVVIIACLLLTGALYGVLSLSLPQLDGTQTSGGVISEVVVNRDALGQAVIYADNRQDAAYGLGYAHGQDRFFQMDLLRRSAAGELSELFGDAAISLDERMRFHQFRQRSERIVKLLPQQHKLALQAYAKGVNDGRTQAGFEGFEYLLTGSAQLPWRPEDSVLVIFAMYLDLQAGNFERDRALIHLESMFGEKMRLFLTQPSQYQAALDGSTIPMPNIQPPELESSAVQAKVSPIASLAHLGSNNWAVTGQLTQTNKAMLSDDMHLGLNVPAIWYRAQLNYSYQGQAWQVTGVSLPGAPSIVVGSNNQIAWGFTNGYLDTADWLELDAHAKTWLITEQIALPNGKFHQYELMMSEFGPVKRFNGKSYALSWVAHQSYAVNLNLLELERATSVAQAMQLAPEVGIPVQNLMVVDAQGSAGWQPMGAIPARTNPVNTAIKQSEYSQLWHKNESVRPSIVNPQGQRLWTANARVVSISEHQRFGDGGYALGARAQQIRDRLTEKSQFTEQDFNQLQQDNEARFLAPWHTHLAELLNSAPQGKAPYGEDLQHLQNWQGCACASSVGYTLVRRFRGALIDEVFAQIEDKLKLQGSSLSHIKNYLEPALWQLLKSQPHSWLNGHDSWQSLQLKAYAQAKAELAQEYGADMSAWRWGEVNALRVKHPFSRQLPILSGLLDMPKVDAFGDTFMPAVQKSDFGASQRFIAQPGSLEKAIMTVAGGQSGHPLSAFYRAGFDDYAQGKATPLLPGEAVHRLTIVPSP